MVRLLTIVPFFVLLSTLSDSLAQVKPISSCLLPTNSPQFAEVCRLSTVTGDDGLLPAISRTTADQVCDQDCRCTHGAPSGGRCGIPIGQSESFCICDYNIDPERTGHCPLPLLFLRGGLCVSIIGNVLNSLCDADCRCSHGYEDTRDHVCRVEEGQTFCICGNRETLRTVNS